MEIVYGANPDGRNSPVRDEKAKKEMARKENESKGAQQSSDDVTSKHVFSFLDHVERSSFRVDRKNIKLGDFTARLRKKIKSFIDVFSTAFEGIGVDSCSTSQSEDDKKEGSSLVLKKRAVPKARDRTNVSTVARKLQYLEGQTVMNEPILVDSPTMSPPASVTFTSPLVPSVDEVFTTPINAPPAQQIVIHTPKSDINTLIWRIKRLHRERKIPWYFDDYDHQLVRSAYALTDRELTLLEGFLGFYKEKRDELDIYCTMVLAGALKKALEHGTWFNTNIMYWWFEVLKERYPDVHFYDPSICSCAYWGDLITIEASSNIY